MKIISQDKSINIIGVEIRTTNDNGIAFKDIPLHWQKFFEESILDQIPNKVSPDVYGIYTNFKNEGINNEGTYSFIIGAQVKTLDHKPTQFVSTVIPKSKYQIFPVKAGHPEKVGEKWQEIWGLTFEQTRTFKTEFELYKETGEIEIFIGIN
jgi:predicted transcriptional regulator YdeE